MTLHFDCCFSPALYSFYKRENDVVVVTDVFRATTTMCSAIKNGASSIIPVANIDDAKRYKANGFLVGAERNTRPCSFADFGNSPFEYRREIVEGKELVFTTSNGTQAIYAAHDAEELLIGAFSNIDVVANRCATLGKRVVVLCAGWNKKANLEDTLFGGALYEKLRAITDVKMESDAVRIAHILWEQAKENPIDFLKNSDHYKRLVTNGFVNQAAYCFEMNTADLLLVFDKEDGKIKRIVH